MHMLMAILYPGTFNELLGLRKTFSLLWISVQLCVDESVDILHPEIPE